MSARARLRVAVVASVTVTASLFGACASGSGGARSTRPLTPAQLAAQDGGIPPYTKADVAFMQGMINHHAQAVTMSSFADANGATSEVRVLAGRITVAQTDEIAFMKTWLGKRKQAVPAGDMEAMAHAPHAGMDMSNMSGAGTRASAGGMMPGMLTTAQMDTLKTAKGPAFDWYFLTFMIQHHRGAISMVDELMSAKGAANDDDVFKFVSDVVADQSTEIDRMELMLKTRSRP
ncbi:DUF305 domain-containing protein [Gemmatimonas groenlandica]|uniref:DUF305 domain-containing protein n=1 Tax=Gemmatimonas groenlandica TaxID=2732249 RepID=A0A6M4IKC7_9BACT|nr:DUF305 domain-containing protein [Gemmatimonas groenlandica]QJR34515.1 DUF305 domain-containing protein [Gemmatimonas groenlandica]